MFSRKKGGGGLFGSILGGRSRNKDKSQQIAVIPEEAEGGGGASKDGSGGEAREGQQQDGPYIFGCFDCNGHCGLATWRERVAELQVWEMEDLQQLAQEREVPGWDKMEREELMAQLAALEELAELRFESRPTFEQVEQALRAELGGGEEDFEFSFHTSDSDYGGGERRVRDDEDLDECVRAMEGLRKDPAGPLAIAVEVHRRERVVHLDCFDADDEDDDAFLGRVTVAEGALWGDALQGLGQELGERVSDGCIIYWVAPPLSGPPLGEGAGRPGAGGGPVMVVDADGGGWSGLRKACLRDARRRVEVDVKLSSHVTRWGLGRREISAGGFTGELEWANPLPVSEDFALESPEGGKARFEGVEVSAGPSPDTVALRVAFTPPEGPCESTWDLLVRGGRGGSHEGYGARPFVIRATVEWV